MNSVKRALTALAAGAIALPLLASPAAAAPGDTAIPPAQDIRTFCTNAFESQFTDLPPAGDNNANELRLAVNCLASATTTTAGNNDTDVIARGNPGTPTQPQGIGADKYGPLLNVTRGQMSSFIARLIDASSVRERADGNIRELPAPAAGNPFPGDVPANYTHLNNIKRLSQAGIVNGNPGTAQQPNGIGADKFGPDLPVTRAQMASFINRAVAYATSNTAPANIARDSGNTIGFTANNAEYYVDPPQQVHERNIKGITLAGISQGVGGDRYDSLANVTRQQMARFLSRTLSRLFGDADPFANRIFSVLESYTANVTNDSRDDEDADAGEGRNIGFEGLNPATVYRVTLVTCENVDQIANDLVRFTVAAGGFADTGNPDSRIVGIGRGQSVDAITPAASTTVTGSASFSVRIENPSDSEECVVAVIYVDGASGKSLSQGGDSSRLEVDSNGFPREFFGISGETQFNEEGTEPPPPPPPADGPIIEDAFVATDAAMGTEPGMATGFASEGDVFQLEFDSAIATATGATLDVEDGDGDSFTIECVEDGGTAADGNTAATCTLSEGGTVLTIELLEEPDVTTGTGGDGVADFPLTITDTTGLEDADGNAVNLEDSTDTEIDEE